MSDTHNPAEWLAEFKRASASHDHAKLHSLRIKIYEQTAKMVTDGGYIDPNGNKVVFPDRKLVRDSAVFKTRTDHNYEDGHFTTNVKVMNEDCLVVANWLWSKGLKPCVLNMASRRMPGGGVLNGAGAQEENLFRRTNLLVSLYPFMENLAREYMLEPREEQYPIERFEGGIYSPTIVVFRGPEGEGYPLLTNPFPVSVATVPAINRPDLTKDGHLTKEMEASYERKIATLFRLALAGGNDALVLGAWGCGAFRNPPADIARLFHRALNSYEFKNKFAVVVFAILDDHNAHLAHNPEGNFAPFAREFS